MSVIQIQGLKKSYGRNIGVRDITLDVDAGEILGFVGPNGAGKSTTIKVLMGFIFPDGGTAAVCGLDCVRDSRAIKAVTGYVPSEVRLYTGMSVGELLRRNAAFYPGDSAAEARRLCDWFEVDPAKRFSELSTGNKKKVSIVCALMASPKVIILDEPTSGLDPMMQKRLFEELGRRTDGGAAVLLSSHNLAEVQEYCHRVAFVRKGAVLATADLSDQREAAKVVSIAGGRPDIPEGLTLLRRDGEVRVLRTLLNGPALLAALGELAPQDISIENESIEDRFWSLYGQEEDAQ